MDHCWHFNKTLDLCLQPAKPHCLLIIHVWLEFYGFNKKERCIFVHVSLKTIL